MQAGDYFAYRINGQSMSPELRDGDTVIERKQDSAKNGSFVLAKIGGVMACRIYRKESNGLYLNAVNPAADSKYFSEDQLKEGAVELCGVVVESTRNYG